MTEPNPFAPGYADPGGSVDLWAQPDDLHALKADRFQRFVGSFVDNMAPAVIALPLTGLALLGGTTSGDDLVAVFYVGYALGFLVVAVLNWGLIVRQGQTIGKIAVGTRIVGEDGGPVDFMRGVVLRNWVITFANAFCNLAYLLDGLMIFQPDVQCLHDKIAKTIVVDANAWDPYQ